jgi:tetratricopeptide (TPR) repeat protein
MLAQQRGQHRRWTMTGQVLDSDLYLNSPADRPKSVPRGWRAGALTLDLELRRLRRGDERIALQETPLRLLCLLLERRGRPVVRRELHHALWPRYDWDSFERNLNTAMRKLRRAIGDDAREPRLIETLRSSGYRWIGAEPEPLLDVPDQRAARDRPCGEVAVSAGAARPGLRRMAWGGAIAAGALLVAVALWPARAERPWLVVESADAVGGTIGRSSRAHALEELLRNVVAGAAARNVGDPVRVALTIRNGGPVSAEVDGRGPARRVALGDTAFGDELLLAEVAERLPAALVGRGADDLAVPAQRAYADAGTLLVGAADRDTVERALELLESVLSTAPAHTGALRMYARAQRVMAVLGRDPAAATERRRVAHDALRRAVIADPRSAAVALDVARQLFWGEWNDAQAAEWFALARRLAPQDVEVLHAYAWFALAGNRIGEAMQAMNAALAVAPLNLPLHTDLGWFYFRTGRYDDALRQCRIAMGMSPGDSSAEICEQRALAELGRPDEAWEALLRHRPDWLSADDAHRLAALDPAAAYRAAMHLAASSARQKQGAGFDSACLEAIAGEREAVDADLAAAVALRDPGLHLARATPELVRMLGESGVRRLAGDEPYRLAATDPERRRLEQRRWNRL